MIRRLSMLAIGAVVGLAVLESGASATTVRSGSTTGPQYAGPVTMALAPGTTWDWSSGFISSTCDASSMTGAIDGSNSVAVDTASWSDSSTGGGACPNNIGSAMTFTALNTPWSGGTITYAGSGGVDGTLTIANVDVSIDNFGTICEYKGSGTNNSITGDLDNATGTVTFNNEGLTKVSGNFLCSGTATYTATYDVRGSGGVQLYVTP